MLWRVMMLLDALEHFDTLHEKKEEKLKISFPCYPMFYPIGIQVINKIKNTLDCGTPSKLTMGYNGACSLITGYSKGSFCDVSTPLVIITQASNRHLTGINKHPKIWQKFIFLHENEQVIVCSACKQQRD